MNIINVIKNLIANKNKEVEFWKDNYARLEEEKDEYYFEATAWRIARHDVFDELVEKGVLSEENRETYYETIDEKYNEVLRVLR